MVGLHTYCSGEHLAVVVNGRRCSSVTPIGASTALAWPLTHSAPQAPVPHAARTLLYNLSVPSVDFASRGHSNLPMASAAAVLVDRVNTLL